jgi:hypothetical protein
VLLLLRQDVLEDPPGGGIVRAEPLDDLGVGSDGDPFGDQVLAQHVLQVGALVVLGVAARQDAFRVVVRLALQLDDAGGEQVRVGQLFVGVHEQFGRDGLGRGRTLGGEVVALVAHPAHDLGRQCLVEDLDDPFTVGAVGGRDRALLDLGPRALAQGGDVCQELGHAHQRRGGRRRRHLDVRGSGRS